MDEMNNASIAALHAAESDDQDDLDKVVQNA